MMNSEPTQTPQLDLPALETLSLQQMSEEAPGLPVLSDSGSVHSNSECSDTSTIKFEQEPFHLFKSRVEELCQTLWPPQKYVGFSWAKSSIAKYIRANRFLSRFIPSQTPPLIERLRGGDNNRITGITLPSSKWGERAQRDLILRVPRSDRGQTAREVATLDYLRQNSSIPTANVVTSEYSDQNVLGTPYVIQDQIPGTDLEVLWNDLNHSQRCTIAREVGRVIRSLLALESPVTGLIEASADTTKTAEPHTIAPFDLKSADGSPVEEPQQEGSTVIGKPREKQTTLQFFQSQIGRWRAVDVADDGPDHMIRLWDSMLEVASQMDKAGLFKPTSHCLCHVDLHPRNIMAKISPNDSSILITGILDWDEAVVAPKFVACEPPAWLWGFDPDDIPYEGQPLWPYESPGANDEPPTAEKRELKRIFEEHAGGEYMSLAYDEHCRLSRGLFRIAVDGLTASWNWQAAERIISDWARLRQDMVD